MSRTLGSPNSVDSDLSPFRQSSESSDFSIWSLIKRSTGESAFCLTSKFRVNAKVRRSFSDTINRPRRVTETGNDEDDRSDSSSSESEQNWTNTDLDEELVELYNGLADKPSGGLLTDTEHGMLFRSLSGVDGSLLEDVVSRGSRAQRVYVSKCALFQLTPSSLFLQALNTTHIDIGHQNTGPKGAEACAIALTQTTSVTELHMNDNAIGYKGAKFLAFMLKNCKAIQILNLADNRIGSRGMKYLAQVIIDYDRIVRLDLSNNGFTDSDADLFKLMIEEARNLSYLNLSHNEFRERGGDLLGDALSYNDGLEELDLSWNHLRRDGAAGLAEGILDNTSLKRLYLGWNGLYLEGSLGLQRMLVYNTTLQVLDLTNNRLSRECIGQLTKGLARNTTLHTLVLKFNPLTQDGALDILQFINECPTSGITLLDLGIQQVTPEFLTTITEVHLQQRPLDVIYGHVIGQTVSHRPEIEKTLLKENPALVLLEFSKLMGFRLIDLFSSLDKDGSRTLSLDEITAGLKMANIPFTEHCIERMIRKLDLNGDGEINFNELLAAQQQYRDKNQKLIMALTGQTNQRPEDSKLWNIRLLLQKLLAEKLSDFSSFKRVSNEIARQIQVSKEAVEGRLTKRKSSRALLPGDQNTSTHAQSDKVPGPAKVLPLEKIHENHVIENFVEDETININY